MHRMPPKDFDIVNDMVKQGYLEMESSFLSKTEADYMSFVFHDKDFSNALALRNRYGHAYDIDDNPYAAEHLQNYYRLLILVIDIALKLNDELRFRAGTEGGVQYVDRKLDSTSAEDVRRAKCAARASRISQLA